MGGTRQFRRKPSPSPSNASSADPTHADGIEGGIDGLVQIHARADASPAASADATLVPIGLSGLVDVSGGRTHAATTGDGHVAVAISEIGRLDIAGGVVALEGLRWEAERRLLPDTTASTTFSVGRLIIAGVPIPLPATDTIPALEQALGPVLGPLGLAIEFPRVRELADGVELTPLTVGIVPGAMPRWHPRPDHRRTSTSTRAVRRVHPRTGLRQLHLHHRAGRAPRSRERRGLWRRRPRRSHGPVQRAVVHLVPGWSRRRSRNTSAPRSGTRRNPAGHGGNEGPDRVRRSDRPRRRPDGSGRSHSPGAVG